MSDRKKSNEIENMSMLKKKSSRKKKSTAPKLEKDFDIKKFRDRVFNEITSSGEMM